MNPKPACFLKFFAPSLLRYFALFWLTKRATVICTCMHRGRCLFAVLVAIVMSFWHVNSSSAIWTLMVCPSSKLAKNQSVMALNAGLLLYLGLAHSGPVCT